MSLALFLFQQLVPGYAFEEHPTVPDGVTVLRVCVCISSLCVYSRPFVLVLCAAQEGLDS